MTRRRLVGVLILVTLPLWRGSGADTALVSAGSVWRYLDNGSDQGMAWRAPGFNDAAWKSGPAQLGYGDGDEATVVGYGPNASNKYITTYFRRAFNVASPSQYTKLTLAVLRDDGAVVYLNGAEVFRTNMPSGTITYSTRAPTAISGAGETTWYSTTVNLALLVPGTNVLAVEIHQANPTSSDVSFDLQLMASDAQPAVTRGPYLQMGTASSMAVRWRTDVATDSRVNYGTEPGAPTWFTDNATSTTEHEVTLSGLLPDTKYCYSVGTILVTLAGGDAGHCFYTAPPVTTVRPYRIWVLGDPGTGSAGQRAVRDAYAAFNGTGRTDLWMMLGDNAYQNGTDAEYQSNVFNIYPSFFRTTVLWPTIGNHDTAQSSTPPPTLPYFMMFTLPTNGEAGGLPSGTEKYYSFDYGNIHFICLDSMSSNRSTSGPMATWLRQDLAATRQRWIIAYWHHPPYSWGTHNSDSAVEDTEMRANIVPILEAGGADLVLTGHSHTYERSFFIDGHYGTSSTFTESMKKDGGNGRIDGTGAYSKPGTGTNEGAVYVVAGTSGQTGSLIGTYPAMFLSLSQLGSLVLDVNGNQLDVRFLRDTGSVADYFTIRKAVVPGPPNAPSNLTISGVSAGQIDLSWTDNASNETGFRIERSDSGGPFAGVTTVNGNITSYADTGLSARTTYTYRVMAYNSAGDSGYSNIVSATTPDTDAPSAPSNLSARAVSGTQIDLSWTASIDNIGVAGYRVERCQSVGCSNFAQVAAPATTSYSDTSAASGVSYSYRVRAADGDGNLSLYSNTASATTPDTVAPTAPSGLTATPAGATQINLSWTASTDNVGVAEYRVERCQDAGCANFTQIATPAGTSYSNTGLAASTSYSYRVRAADVAGNPSVYSSVASATTPAPPPANPPAAAFGFNETSGPTTADASGNGYTGTLTNGPTRIAGKNGNALSFDGVDDKVALPSALDVSALPFTFEAWVRPLNYSTWHAIFSKRSSYSTSGMRFDVGLENGDGRVYLTTYQSFPVFTYAPPLNTWTHLAVVADSTGTRLYVNGALQQSLGAITLGTGATAAVNIGRTGDNEDPFAGSIDDLRLYKRVLTQTEIQTDMNTPLP